MTPGWPVGIGADCHCWGDGGEPHTATWTSYVVPWDRVQHKSHYYNAHGGGHSPLRIVLLLTSSSRCHYVLSYQHFNSHMQQTRLLNACTLRSCDTPVDDAASVQIVQAARDVHGYLASLVVPRVAVRLLVQGMPQVTALQTIKGLGFRRVNTRGLYQVSTLPAIRGLGFRHVNTRGCLSSPPCKHLGA